MNNYYYQVGGSLPLNAPTYITRKADEDLYQALKRGEFCYVLNSRQMGKSSLRVRTMQRLQEIGIKCVAIDITAIGTSEISPEEWYFGVIDSIISSLEIYDEFDLDRWWEDNNKFSIVHRFSKFLKEGVLSYVPEKIVIFIDEIDSVLSLPFKIDDFFAVIRECYNQRVDTEEYKRLSFALIGVATPGDLISDKRRTPFNIGTAIELSGFTLTEAQPLKLGLEGLTVHPDLLIEEILKWTGGQPFLTQKLCNLIKNQRVNIPENQEKEWLEKLVNQRIIEGWEIQDEPEHLRTIQNRILVNQQTASRLLGLYQQIIQGDLILEGSPEETRLRLTGLVVKKEGGLQVYNLIYATIFNQEWLEQQLAKLRPYNESFNAWVESNYEDESRLLRGQALIDALNWSANKNLSSQEHRYLGESQRLEQRVIQLELEAQKKANKILAEANRKAELRLAETEEKLRKTQMEAEEKLKQTEEKIEKLMTKNRILSDLTDIRLKVKIAENTLRENPLESLIESLKAAQLLKSILQSYWEQDNTKSQVFNILHKAVYTIHNYQSLSGHTDKVNAVIFSPDGEIIASASDDNTIKLWTKNGVLIQTLSDHIDKVSGVKFSPDGKLLVSVSRDNTVKLWKKNGALLNTLSGLKGWVHRVSFSPDGEIIASTGSDHTIKLWTKDIIVLATFSGHTDLINQVSFSPDGEIIASASDDETIKLWTKDGTLITTLSGHTDKVNDLSFSPDGEIFASASADYTLKLWKRDGTFITTVSGHTDSVITVSFSPDGEIFASGSTDKTIKLWKRDGTCIKTFYAHSYSITAISFSPDGEIIASASLDKTVKLWRINGILLPTLSGHNNRVTAVSFSPDGEIIASASADHTLKLWKTDGTFIKTLSGHTDYIWGVSFSPDGEIIASAGGDTVKLWKRDGTFITSLSGHTNTVNGVSFSPDGEIIVSAGDNTVKLWKKDGTFIKSLSGHTDSVSGVSFSPDGEIIASASGDNTVKLWKKDGTLIKSLSGHTDFVSGVSFSPDREIIASASWDKTVKLWKKDGTFIKSLSGHTDELYGLSFSPDGEMIASASGDKTIKLWKKDGTFIKSFSGHTDGVFGVSFSPDGKTLASSSADTTIILWDLTLDIDQLVALGCHWLQDYFITHPEVKKELSICQDQAILKLTPSLLFKQAQESATVGSIHQSLALFTEAQKLDSRLTFNPEKDVNQPASLYWMNRAKSYVEEGHPQLVKFLFNKALKLNPKLNINIEAEIALAEGIDALNPEKNKDIKKAIEKYQTAIKINPSIDISLYPWNGLCWYGSLNGYAQEVLFACENAVKLAPKKGNIRDSRGLARALTGDYKGAIEDFQAYVEWTNNEEKKKQRQEWIKTLKAGKNPFTRELLEKLK
jgi:WD40 repeat protein